MKSNYPLMTLLLITGLAAGFFGGQKYQQSKAPVPFSGLNGGNRVLMRDGSNSTRRLQGGGMVTGEILSSDDKSITVKLPDGSSKLIFISDTTSVNKASTGSKADLKTGEKVTVMGTANSDGSVSAQNIQLGSSFKLQPAVSGTPSGSQ